MCERPSCTCLLPKKAMCGILDEPVIPTFTSWDASISLETLAKSFLNPSDMHCRVLSVRGEQITGSPLSRKGKRRMRGQLFICELLQQMQRFLPRCRQIRAVVRSQPPSPLWIIRTNFVRLMPKGIYSGMLWAKWKRLPGS